MHTAQEPTHTLVLNAAEGIIQFLLARQEAPEQGSAQHLTPRCFQGWHAQGQGAELLCPALENALALLRVPVPSVQRIACVQGPGSFTGIRLALGTAAGLARATGATLAGLDYTVLLAQAALRRLSVGSTVPTSLLVATHARRGLVHARLFQVAGNTTTPCGPVQALSLEAAANAAKAATASAMAATTTQASTTSPTGHTLPQYMAVLGSGLTRNKLFWEEVCAATPGVCLLPPWFDHPEEADLLHAAQEASYGRQDIDPVYVRPSDAEENLEGIAQKLGLNPAEARTSLELLTTESTRIPK
ncbi:tRNA (adenosine(37)-N6)-threonylcarbamoyltransferase complex dimerization subunit type 1 TsaB [Desulfovibrio cuneatus]|uniref:tRNA (adenosine(37)-N6)-threonylcarbamoyltransferase complex dimerization subunit type 1 TsaB n=1 Tax=Desulfovibrio cuneatus TaxID=159728 RepID=UPI00040803FE|nr:tRNA (adenosine(37)-N6)-threonylcarbamoyltransferase complex dimerization subunit type 1 TsaB [Desulfovibrio cuneatus]